MSIRDKMEAKWMLASIAVHLARDNGFVRFSVVVVICSIEGQRGTRLKPPSGISMHPKSWDLKIGAKP